MMMNLFNSFDPSTSNLFSFNWLSMMFVLIFTPLIFWIIPSSFQILVFMLKSFFLKEIKNNISNSNFKILIFLFSLFWFILINNLMGLFPYIFTATSHLTITLLLALSSWLTLMCFGWMMKTNSMFSHLVPLGTPMLLSSFMVLIETVSNLIRPITLSVRLSANMIAGHLLLTLLSNISENSPFLYFISFPFLLMLLMLEYAVAMIQSYVFVTLTSLYISEIN